MDNLPKGWTSKPIEQIFKIRSGNFIPKSESVAEGEYLIYGGNGITGKHHSFNIAGENIIIGRVGAKCGNVRRIKEPIWLSDNAFYISYYYIDIYKPYLQIFLEYIDLGKTANQAAQPVISFKGIKDIPVPLPPLSEQIRIVAKLDSLFARIDKSITLLEKNIKHTKALMASVLEEVFHSSMKQIAVSEIVVKTFNINPLVEPDTQFTYIDITSVNNRLHQIEDPKIILGKNAPSRAKKLVVVGDIVFATTRPNLKNIAIVNKNYSNPVASTGFCVLKTKKEISNEFLFLCLLSNNVQEQIKPFIRGAQYPAISDSDLLKCKIPDLSYAQQIEFANKIMNLRNKLSKINSEQQSKLVYLKALKSSLLDRAFKGEL